MLGNALMSRQVLYVRAFVQGLDCDSLVLGQSVVVANSKFPGCELAYTASSVRMWSKVHFHIAYPLSLVQVCTCRDTGTDNDSDAGISVQRGWPR